MRTSTSSTSSNDNLNRSADAHSAADATRPPFANAEGHLETGGLRAPTSSRLIGWDGNGHDPEQFLDWSKPGMLWFDPCDECGQEFVFVRARGRPRGFCSEACARAYELRQKASLRRERDPGIGTEERKQNQLAALKWKRHLALLRKSELQVRNDLKRGSPFVGSIMGADHGDDQVQITGRHRPTPTTGWNPETGAPTGIAPDPVWHLAQRFKTETGQTPRIYWQDVFGADGPELENFPPPPGYDPNKGRRPSTAPQPWEPITLSDYDAPGRKEYAMPQPTNAEIVVRMDALEENLKTTLEEFAAIAMRIAGRIPEHQGVASAVDDLLLDIARRGA